MRRFHWALLIVVLFSSSPSDVWASFIFQGHEYTLTSVASDWNSADAEANSLGGYLVAINSAEEQAFIENTFLIGAFERSPLWIGLTDKASEGNFSTWTNGESLTYTNWKIGEPNDYLLNEDYVTINWDYSRFMGQKGTWNDTPLNGSSGFAGNTNGPYFGIIEIDATVTATPEPSSIAIFGFGAIGLGIAARRRQRKVKAIG